MSRAVDFQSGAFAAGMLRSAKRAVGSPAESFLGAADVLGGGGFGIKGAPAGLLRWLGSSVRVVGSKETP